MRGWKTLAFNGGLGLGAVAAEVLNYLGAVDWQTILPPERAGVAVLVVGAANILLRHVTEGPAGWRKR